MTIDIFTIFESVAVLGIVLGSVWGAFGDSLYTCKAMYINSFYNYGEDGDSFTLQCLHAYAHPRMRSHTHTRPLRPPAAHEPSPSSPGGTLLFAHDGLRGEATVPILSPQPSPAPENSQPCNSMTTVYPHPRPRARRPRVYARMTRARRDAPAWRPRTCDHARCARMCRTRARRTHALRPCASHPHTRHMHTPHSAGAANITRAHEIASIWPQRPATYGVAWGGVMNGQIGGILALGDWWAFERGAGM